jgi:hypothetical protein
VSRPLPDLNRRHRALEKTLAKYRGRPRDWKTIDCVRMLRSHLVAMGHKKVPKLPRYSSALGAKRALKAAGFATIAEMIDSILPRIAPAMALPGDVLLVRGDEGFDAVTLSLGHKAFGWHEEAEGAVVLVLHEIEGAWRA